MSEQLSTIKGFESVERAHLAHAIVAYGEARAGVERATRRLSRALAAVARAEGLDDDPTRWGALLTGERPQGGAVSRP